ncbi:MAG TPA: hypothetical protein VHG71_11070 [Verrucomicrobiae bacterium]|nr:hypothetical protein [Verrucomicrobiae bacterium]
MKRKLFSKTCRQTILAIPAAALMLGASSHAGLVGINYTEDFGVYTANGNGSNYGTGYGYFVYGYQTTGFNVTATAFGVPAADWSNIQLPFSSTINSTNAVGPITVITTAGAAQCSGIGNTNFVYSDYYSWFMTAGVQPGNDEVTWAYLDDQAQYSDTSPLPYTPWNVQLSGLKTAYPNGYTIQTIGYPWIFDATQNPSAPEVNISDGATFTNKLAYTDLGARQGAWGNDISHAGLSSVSPVLTSDVVNIFGDPPFNSTTPPGADPRIHSTLCGFIITDAGAVTPPILSIVGNSLEWTSGTLQSSPALGPSAVWTIVPNAVSPYQFLPSALPSMFYRLTVP